MSEGTNNTALRGSLAALITPMTTDGAIDEDALRRLVQWHIDVGTHGLVPTGTTGESPVLSHAEQHRVIEIVCEQAGGAIPVIAGCGSNNTHEALENHAHAADAGATATLHVTGYYNRPSQEGVIQHYRALNALNDLPIIVYNIPARTHVDITVDTMATLAALPNVVGVKDATKDLSRPCLEKVVIPSFSWLSGEDSTAVAYNAAGGNGCISTTANVAPELCSAMQAACLKGDFNEAMQIQQRLTPLHDALFIEPSPAGVKYACARRKLCGETARLPMVPLTKATKAAIDAALEQLELGHV
jgi:4-hydroxy-tetrahydrodipicolinate synthase